MWVFIDQLYHTIPLFTKLTIWFYSLTHCQDDWLMDLLRIWLEEWSNAWINERTRERTNERTSELSYHRTNERVEERANDRITERTNKGTNEWTIVSPNERTNERTNEQTNKRTNERTNARTHERTNEQMRRWTGESTKDGRTNEAISIELRGDGRVCKQMNKYVRECLSMLIVRCHIILTISWVISILWKYFLGWIQSDCLKGNCWSRDELKKLFKDLHKQRLSCILNMYLIFRDICNFV